MVNPNLLDYVRQELSRGVSKEQLKAVLVQNNWPEGEVEEAIRQAEAESVPAKESEEVLKSIVEEFEKKEPVVEKKFLTSVEATSVTLESKQPQSQIQPVIAERTPVTVERKKLPLKYLTAGGLIILIIASLVFYFFVYDTEEHSISVDDQAMLLAKSVCKGYCEKGECELFKNPQFVAPKLKDKTCVNLEVKCPKCD